MKANECVFVCVRRPRLDDADVVDDKVTRLYEVSMTVFFIFFLLFLNTDDQRHVIDLTLGVCVGKNL